MTASTAFMWILSPLVALRKSAVSKAPARWIRPGLPNQRSDRWQRQLRKYLVRGGRPALDA